MKRIETEKRLKYKLIGILEEQVDLNNSSERYAIKLNEKNENDDLNKPTKTTVNNAC